MSIYINRLISEPPNLATLSELTLLENRSTFCKCEQQNAISTALLEATVSSAWTESVPKFLETRGP